MSIRQAAIEGGRAALAAFGLPQQPALSKSIGIDLPKAPGLPKAGTPSSRLAVDSPSVPTASPSMGNAAGKIAFNVGVGASNMPTGGAGAVQGEPADVGRRQRSVIDRALQRNDDDYATSSMPLPGAVVSP